MVDLETKNDLFVDEEAEGKTIDQTSILSSFKAAVQNVTQDENKLEVPDVASVPISTMMAQAPQEKTLKEILEERETELKELEQLDTIQDKGYMEALVEDIETKPTAQVAPIVASKPAEDEGKSAADDGEKPSATPSTNAQEDLTAELKKKFNIDAMTAEKEAEIQKIVAELDAFKDEIEES